MLSASGVYTFTLGSQALSHASATAPTITAPQFAPGSRNQVWAAVVNSTSATFQNIATFSYMAIVSASGVPAIVPSTTPFTWTVVPSNGNNKSVLTSRRPLCAFAHGGVDVGFARARSASS